MDEQVAVVPEVILPENCFSLALFASGVVTAADDDSEGQSE